MNKTRLTLTIATLAVATIGAEAVTLNNVMPGTLKARVKEATISDRTLKLTGQIDIRDLLALQELAPKFDTVDLSATTMTPFASPAPLHLNYSSFTPEMLPSYIFAGIDLQKLSLPAGITTIGDGAFAGSSIKEIVLPSSVFEIGDYAFRGCSNLTKCNLPLSLRSLGKGAFSNTALTEANLAATSITAISEDLFNGCTALKTITFPSTLAEINTLAFAGTVIENLPAADRITVTPFAMAQMPHLETSGVALQNSEEAEGLYLGNTYLNTAPDISGHVPAGIYALCTRFNGGAVTPNASYIGDYALACTGSGNELKLSGSLSWIGRGAFSDMPTFSVIDVSQCGATPVPVDPDAFEGLPCDLITVKIDHIDHQDAWRNAPGWCRFTNFKAETIGIDSNMGGLDITVEYIDGRLLVTAPENIQTVDVYGTDGRIIGHSAPGATQASIPLAATTQTIVVITRTESTIQTDKLLIY